MLTVNNTTEANNNQQLGHVGNREQSTALVVTVSNWVGSPLTTSITTINTQYHITMVALGFNG